MHVKMKKEYIDFKNKYKNKIKRLHGIFYEDNHKYLHEKRLPNKIKEEIDDVWHELRKLNYSIWNEILATEIEDLKQISIYKGTKNREYWEKTIIMNWFNDFINNSVRIDYFFYALDKRRSYLLFLREVFDITEWRKRYGYIE